MSKRILLIDDTRDESSKNIHLKPTVIARNYWFGIEQLVSNGPWDLLLLDHDIASFCDVTGREYTGYDVMCWLEDPDHIEYRPKEIKCVSANPVGRRRIEMIIDKLYKESR